MKCKEIRLPQDLDKSFIVFREKGQYIPCPWHFHPEYELVLILKSTGKRMVGDHIDKFQTGDLVLVGPYLPHVWSNDPIYVNGQATEEADALVIQFKEDFLGGEFLNLPEMEPFRNFQKLSRRGMSFFGKAKKQINPLITEMIHMNGIQRLSNLLSIFDILAHTEEYELLASPVYVAQLDPPNTDRVSKVKNYILNNFTRDISLAEVASIANMAVSTFCMFFKDKYRITFVEYLNSIRVGHACKLLMEENDSILEVAYKSGFNNLANFNRQFKKFKSMTPTQFKKAMNMSEMA